MAEPELFTEAWWDKNCPGWRERAARLAASRAAARPAQQIQVIFSSPSTPPASTAPQPPPHVRRVLDRIAAAEAEERPTGPPPPVGPPSLISDTGVVLDHILGVGYRPRSMFGLEQAATGISGHPLAAWSPAGPRPARTLAGTPITGPGGRALYRPAGYGPPPPFRPAG